MAPEEIAEVDIATHPRWLSVCNIAAPATGLEAKFSYRATAAMALLGHETQAMESFADARVTAPDVAELREKVRVRADPSVPETAARVRVIGAETYEAQADLAQPMTIETRTAKLRAKASALIGTAQADALWAASQSGDVRALTRQMAG